MTGRTIYDHATTGDLDLARRRRRSLDLAAMLTLEALCALAGTASFLALARNELAWATVFAIAAIIAYSAAGEVDPT